jgi:hypothetical protein
MEPNWSPEQQREQELRLWRQWLIFAILIVATLLLGILLVVFGRQIGYVFGAVSVALLLSAMLNIPTPRREESRVDQEQQDGQSSHLLWTSGILVALAFVSIVTCGYLFGWKWTGVPKQTLWDWLSLLIVPAVLAVGGFLFTRSENQRTLQNSKQQREVDREVAKQQAETDRDSRPTQARRRSSSVPRSDWSTAAR